MEHVNMRHVKLVQGLIMISAALLLAPKCGDPVVVPASDPSPPGIGARIDSNGQTWSTGLPSQPLDVTTSNLDQIFDVWVTGLDPEGTRKVSMFESAEWQCRSGSVASRTSGLSVPIEETQAGGVGQTVYSGIYVGRRLTMRTTSRCQSGWRLEWIRRSFSARAENFHGGVNEWHVATLRYP